MKDVCRVSFLMFVCLWYGKEQSSCFGVVFHRIIKEAEDTSTINQILDENDTAIRILFDDYKPLCLLRGLQYCDCNMTHSTSLGSLKEFLNFPPSIFVWQLLGRNESDKVTDEYILEPLNPDLEMLDQENYAEFDLSNDSERWKPKRCLHGEKEATLSHCLSVIDAQDTHSKMNFMSITDNLTAWINFYTSRCEIWKQNNWYHICSCSQSTPLYFHHELKPKCTLLKINTMDRNDLVITYQYIEMINMTKEKEVFVIAPNMRKINCTDTTLLKNDHDLGFMSDSVTLQVTDFVFSMVSLLSLFLTLFVFATCPELRNLHGKNLVSLSVTLFFSQIMFLKNIAVQDDHLCNALGAFLHYCWLSVFHWTSIMAYDLAKTFRQKSAVNLKLVQQHIHEKQYRRYAIVAWGFPIIIIVICLLFNVSDLESVYGGHFNEGICMVTHPTAIYGLFVPFGIGTVFNIACFAVIVHGIESKKIRTQKYRLRYERTRCFIYIKLSVLLGMSWVICLIATLHTSRGLWFSFSFINNVHGVSIFLSFFLFNRRVRGILKKRLTYGDSNPATPVLNSIENAFKDVCQNQESTDKGNVVKKIETSQINVQKTKM